MIRRATISDFDKVVNMAYRFANESSYAGFCSEDKINALVENILDNYVHNSVILIDDEYKGMLAGCISPFLLGEGFIASELAWWVNSESRKENVGLELLNSFEEWASDQGCKFITMACLDDSVGKFYERNGYQLQERAYFKVIN